MENHARVARVILDRVAVEFGLGAQGDEERISAAGTRRRAPRGQTLRAGRLRALSGRCRADAEPPSRRRIARRERARANGAADRGGQ
jgi:hypothetical protein